MNLAIFFRRLLYWLLASVDRLLGRKTRLFILCYHSIAEDDWRYGVGPSEFQQQIGTLLTDYTPITLSDVALYVSGQKELTKPSFVITFDDGYSDILQARSFLAEKGIRPTLFSLSSDSVDTQETGVTKPLLTPTQTQSLLANGWELGCHGGTHANFWNLSSAAVIREVTLAKASLEQKIGIPAHYFAYPKGRYTDAVLKTVAESGYTLGLTMVDGFISGHINPFLVPRIGVDRSHSLAEFKTLYSPSVILVRGILKKNWYRLIRRLRWANGREETKVAI